MDDFNLSFDNAKKSIDSLGYDQTDKLYHVISAIQKNHRRLVMLNFQPSYLDSLSTVKHMLKDAIKWVNENKTDSANLSFDMMRQPPENVELFLNRVNFTYVDGDELVEKVKNYFQILIDQGILETEVDQKLLDMFKL